MKVHHAWTALLLLILHCNGAALPAAGEAATAAGRWRQLGPAELGFGEVFTLAADPTRPERVLAGMDGGGIGRSGDAGRTWRMFGDGLASPQINLIAVHPALGRLVYAAGEGHYLHRSVNDGRTWTRLPLTGIRVLALDPRDTNAVWAGTPGGLFRSADRGNTWQRIQANLPANYGVRALAVDQADPRRIYLGIPGAGGAGFWVSENGGRSWTRRSPTVPAVLYADLHAARTVYFQRGPALQRSRDAGLTWELFFLQGDTGLPESTPRLLAADPLDPATFYVVAGLGDSSVRLFRTTDAGRTWRPLEGGGLPERAALTALAVTSDGAVLVGTRFGFSDFGVFRSEDRGASWAPASRGLVNTPVRAVAVTPAGAIFVALPFEGVARSLDGGATWTSSLELADPQVIGLTADPNDPDTVYATTRFQFGREHHFVWRTADNGETWEALPYPLPTTGQVFSLDARDLAVDPTDSRRLFIATELNNAGLREWAGIFRSEDGGQTWEKVGQAGVYYAVETHPGAPGRVLALSPLGVYRSDDHGDTWERTLSFDGRDLLYDMAVAPSDPNVVYVHQGDGTLFRSDDGGATFADLGRRLPVGGPRAMVVDPLDPNVLIFQGNGGVVRLTLGSGREILNQGLIDRTVPVLLFDPNDPLRLFGGTAGAGLFEMRFTRVPRP